MQGRLEMMRFDTIRSNRYDSCPLMSSRHTGILDVNLLSRDGFKNEEGSCIIISRTLTSGSADRQHANRVES